MPLKLSTLLFIIFISGTMYGNGGHGPLQVNSCDALRADSILQWAKFYSDPDVVQDSLTIEQKQKKKKTRRIIAAILAFPFPFGIVGLHRIYLGCAPYVPVVYISSVGGAFGILPFIDFIVLLLDKDIDRYINNQKVFMWVN